MGKTLGSILVIAILFLNTAKGVSTEKYIPLGGGTPINYNGIPFHYGTLATVQKTDSQLVKKKRVDLPGYAVERIHIIEHAAWATNVPDGVKVGTIRVIYEDNTSDHLDLIMGENIAEWAYDRPDVQCCIAHSGVSPAYSFRTKIDWKEYYWGHSYYVNLQCRPKLLAYLELEMHSDAYTNRVSCPESCGGTPPDWFQIGIMGLTLEVAAGIDLVSVDSEYRGFVYFLDEVDHFVTYTANIVWADHPPGFVEFKTPRREVIVPAGGPAVASTFNMGKDFGPCGRLEVVAESSEGIRSNKLIANCIVMSNCFQGWVLRSEDVGDGFFYTLDIAVNSEFFDEGVDADIIPEKIPLFGGSPFGVSFIPQLAAEVTSQGEFQLTFRREDLQAGEILNRRWGREHNLSRIVELLKEFMDKGRVDRRRLPKVDMAGFEIYLYPIVDIEGQFDPSLCRWNFDGYVGIAGSIELRKSWPFILMAGPIPVLMYAKASIELTTDLEVGVTGWPPQENLNGRLKLEPDVRGSLGAGVDSVLSVEGWIGGGANFGLQFPETPHLEELTLYLNGGVTITAFLWKWENELLRWDWEYVKSVQGISILEESPSGLEENRVPVLIPRDYVLRPGYGRFVQRPRWKLSIKETEGERYVIAKGEIQSTVFPYSKPSLSSSGGNLYLTYLYDDSNRSSVNRTVAMFSTWNGTDWSDPMPIWDDGTADFSPQILAFSDGSAIAAWEDVKSVLPETATLEDMVAAMEISVAKYDPVTRQWLSPLKLSSNGYLDRTPRLAGISPDNVMVTWISNEGDDIRGNDSKPNLLWYSIWNGADWSQPQIITEIARGIVKTSTAYDGKRACIVMSIDTDDKAETIEDHDLFLITYDSGSWGPLIRLTNDITQDDNPQLGIDPDGRFVLSWVKGNDLVTSVDFDIHNRQTITTNEYSSSFADFRMATGGSGRLAILWAEASENDSDIYAVFYDPLFQTWGKPKQLTFDQETERDLATAFYGDGILVAVYNRVKMGTSQLTRSTPSGKIVSFSIPEPGETELYMLRYVIGGDMGLKSGSLMIEPSNPPPGTEATLKVTAVNLGESSVSGIPVAFYSGNPAEGGAEIGRTFLTDVLNSGDESEVSLNWTIPETAAPLDIYVVIDPDQEMEDRDRTNNMTNDRFVKADLSIESGSSLPLSDKLVSITARIRNQGVITSPETQVVFRLGSTEGRVVSSVELQSLDPGGATDVGFLWDVTDMAIPFTRILAVVDESRAVDDFERANNSATILVNLFHPEITVSPAYVAFGSIVVNSFLDQIIKISNEGTANLTLSTIGTPSAPFSRVGGTCADGQILAAGEECLLIVRFSPGTKGEFISAFTVSSDDPDEGVLTINLYGTGVEPDIVVSSTNVDFGKVLKGVFLERTITIGNSGDAPLTINGIEAPALPFSIAGGTCKSGDTLPAGGGSCTIVVRFAPEAQGAFSSSLNISSDDPDESTVVINLSGQGVLLWLTPEEGTIGTEIEIKGAEFGVAKGKVLIGGIPLKILEWTETEIRGVLNKVSPPDIAMEVKVLPRAPKGAEIVEPEAFTTRRPEIMSLDPGSGISGGTSLITIQGRFFSTKKGKVALERGSVVKSCKVRDWRMNPLTGDSQIQFLVPKGLAPGDDYTLRVTNKVGAATAPFSIAP